MQLKTILNRVLRHSAFVYVAERLVETVAGPIVEVQLRARANSRPRCSCCKCPGPGYDTLAQRRFEFVPLWGIKVFFLYAPRRVSCARCGVRVEALPWAVGKHRLTTAYAWFLARWAKRLSWKEVAEVFQTSWDNVFHAVEMAVEWGREHRDLSAITAIGVDEVQWQRGHRYLTLVYQIDTHCKRLLWVGKERKLKTLLGFFRWFGRERSAALKFVASDMWKPYLRVIAKKAGHAVHVLDRFHIMAHLSKAIDEVRAGEAKALKAVIDGVFEPDQCDEAVRFREAVLTDADIQWVQARVRQRVLRWFARQGYLDKDEAKDMAEWRNGGGFSVDASVRIEADDRPGLERLLRYCARPPFALERLEAIDAQRLMYHLPKPRPDGRTALILTPLELIDRLAALIPPPHTHRHRYHGVLAPNATLRGAVTALAREASNGAQQQADHKKEGIEDAVEAIWRSPARYLWAMLLARIYESAPLACPQCGADMRIIAFVTESVSVRRILTHIGEPTDPPRIAPARPCATQSCFACVPAHAFHGLGVRCSSAAHPPAWEAETESLPLADPIAQAEPDFQFDQTVDW